MIERIRGCDTRPTLANAERAKFRILRDLAVFTFLLFLLAAAAVVLGWNRFFRPVRYGVACTCWLVCAAYLAPTLLSSKVDVPGNLAFAAYPWQGTGGVAAKANTGIVFTQIAPWTASARASLATGALPLWNRASASGAPLLANQQTAIFHPFTLLGLLLPLGKAFTLTAALRLFVVAFFTFVFLRNLGLQDGVSVFGALAYAFCSFHIVWLLFPLGLSSMMLPVCLVGVQELRRTAIAGYVLLVLALSLTVLGGHPESAVWVWIVTACFSTFEVALLRSSAAAMSKALVLAASSFVFAMLLTAWWWYPTLAALPLTGRFNAVQSLEANPADHGLSQEWLLPLVTPNVLGTPTNGTYTPPRGVHPAVLNDYGEVASSYAGLATLGLALAAPFVSRRRSVLLLALALMLVSVATFGELPIWRDLVRRIPLVGISIHQRLRLFWDLGVCIAAALTLQSVQETPTARRASVAALVTAIASFVLVYAWRQPVFLRDPLGLAQLIVPLLSAVFVTAAVWKGKAVIPVATVAVFLDLLVATYAYNPSCRPADLYPRTGAIQALQRGPKPYRVAAVGWSLLPDTPAAYGLEDVKTTDPVQHAAYMRLLKGYLRIDPGSYDLEIRDLSQPFFDYLNIRYVYAPPGQAPTAPKLVRVYEGADGSVFENTKSLPRYFLVRRFRVQSDFERALAMSLSIRNFADEAIVDHIPEKVAKRAPALATGAVLGGSVRLLDYGPNTSSLAIESRGWNLLVSSDVSWPGWRPYWNGERQPPVIVNGTFLGCFIPPGNGRLELRYRPDEFDQGLQAAAVGFVGLVALVLVRRRQLAPRPSPR